MADLELAAFFRVLAKADAEYVPTESPPREPARPPADFVAALRRADKAFAGGLRGSVATVSLPSRRPSSPGRRARSTRRPSRRTARTSRGSPPREDDEPDLA